MSQYECLQLIIGGITAMIALFIGIQQILINKRLRDIQDVNSAIITLNISGGEVFLGVVNSGTNELYIIGYKIGEDEIVYNPGKVTLGRQANYNIVEIDSSYLQKNSEFKVQVNLEDSRGKAYHLEGVIEIGKRVELPDGKFFDRNVISYKLKKVD